MIAPGNIAEDDIVIGQFYSSGFINNRLPIRRCMNRIHHSKNSIARPNGWHPTPSPLVVTASPPEGYHRNREFRAADLTSR